jgi:hypothetical protein
VTARLWGPRGLVAALLSGVGALAAAQTPAPRDVEVRTSLDRTAVWVADRVTYTIAIACRKGVDILVDDVSKDKLRLDGLEIVASDADRTIDRDDRTTHTFHFTLTTYRVDASELTIGGLTVRYAVKRTGQRLEDAAPAGEVQVPPAVVAFRSALPDGQETYQIRDGRGPRPRGVVYAWLRPIGVSLVLIAIVPAVAAVAAAVRRARPRVRQRSARQIRQDERTSLDEIEALDVSTVAGRREAYTRLNALVREHLTRAGIEAAGLTPAEIEAAAARSGGQVPVELAAGVLNACDRARFAPPESWPSADDCRDAIEQCSRLL